MRRILRSSARAGLAILLIVVATLGLYGGVAFALIVWQTTQTPPDGPAAPVTPVYVVSNDFHADIVIPVRSPAVDWLEVLDPWPFPFVDPVVVRYVSFGWGDRDFYTETPEVGDLRIGSALRALFASRGSVVHVTLWGGPPEPGPGVRSLELAPPALEAVVDGILASFARDERDEAIHIGMGYTLGDTFYEGVGRYSPFFTCNEWAAAILRPAGVTLPLWSPFAFGLI